MKNLLNMSIKDLENNFCNHVKDIYTNGQKVSTPDLRDYIETELRESGKLRYFWFRSGLTEIGLLTNLNDVEVSINANIKAGKSGRNIKFDNCYIEINIPTYQIKRKESDKFILQRSGHITSNTKLNEEYITTSISDLTSQVYQEGTELNSLLRKETEMAMANEIFKYII